MRESVKEGDAESREPTTPRILHITEALGGGIHSAIASWAAATPDVQHLVLARVRPGQATYAWPDNVTQDLQNTSLSGLFLQSIVIAREYEPRAIHLHSSKAGIFRAGKYRAERVVYSPHCFAFERRDICGAMRSFYRFIEKRLALRAVIASVSQEEERLARSLRCGVRTTLVPNYSQIERRELKVDSRSIVTVGRILPQKDPQFFLDTVRNLNSNYKITWIGDGDPNVRNQLTDLGVEVTGWLPMKELVPRVSSAGLYVHTAAWEGSPLSTLEAINAGTPVLSRDIPSMRAIGYEVPSETPQGLAAAVERYFADDAYREKVLRSCRNIQSQNSQAMASEKLRQIYFDDMIPIQETT